MAEFWCVIEWIVLPSVSIALRKVRYASGLSMKWACCEGVTGFCQCFVS